MGGGKGSSTTQVQMTPEQRRVLEIQANALENTFMPAYEKTVGGAGDVYGQVAPAVEAGTNRAMGIAQQTGNLQQATGTAGLLTGMTGLGSLFDPQYEEQQVQAALQAGRESTREQLAGQNAMYGGAGGLGSARQALADKNLQQLGEQRQATAAAAARAGVQANKAAAAQALLGAGQTQLSAANQLAAAVPQLAQIPQDAYSKYASVVFGVPQSSTTADFSGTQGKQTTSKGFGF